MGYFRRFKLNDHSADDCRKILRRMGHQLIANAGNLSLNELEHDLEQWACFRELLARHENQNKSELDNESKASN